ncbi:MAG: hypothetical protein AAFX58_07860, partial [Pseudomonadota bacterium]
DHEVEHARQALDTRAIVVEQDDRSGEERDLVPLPFGLRRRGGYIDVEPCLPDDWKEARVSWKLAKTEYRFVYRESDTVTATVICRDGRPVDRVALTPDAGVVTIDVIVPASPTSPS